MAETVKPYKNNTLAGIAGNIKAQSLADQRKAWEQAREMVANAKEFWKNFLEAEKDIFIDNPSKVANSVASFVLWSPEANLPKWQAMPVSTDRLKDIKQPLVAESTNTLSGESMSGWANIPTTQTAVSNQNTQWTSNSVVTPSEFQWFSNALENQWEQSQWGQQWEQWQYQTDENYNNLVIQNMENDLNQTSGDVIYWKTTWDSWNPNWWITVSEDVNSAFRIVNENRIETMKNVLNQNPYMIASSMAAWYMPYSDTTMEDVSRYAPEFYNQIQQYVKQIQSWEIANAISFWDDLPDTSSSAITNVNSGVNTWAASISSDPQQTSYIINNANEYMASSQTANISREWILTLDDEITTWQKKIDNLRTEANNKFKWDTPDYIVNAYISNRRQQYQAEIDKLEWRRSTYLELYKMDLNNYQWGEEMKYKYLQHNQQVNNEMWDRYYKEKQLTMSNIKWDNWKAYQINGDWTITQLTDATAYYSYLNDVNTALEWYKAIYTAWWGTKTHNWYKYNVSGWQCQSFTNNFTEQTTWLRMNWVYASDKLSYMNSTTPTVWSVAIAVWWVYDSTYWHTMLVTWYDPNTWIVDLLWSNNWWDELVYTTQDTLSNLYARWLKWFRDPYQDLIKQSNTAAAWYTANGARVTPITSLVWELIEKWKNNESVWTAEYTYNTLYWIIEDNSLETLINSWDMAKVVSYMTKWKFWEVWDDRWYKFKNRLKQYITKEAARELSWWDASLHALNELMTVVERKLREESWAAINSSEWLTNFEMFLPAAWESEDYQWQKMQKWDDIIINDLRKWWMWNDLYNQYVPIFPKNTVREIW